MASVDRAAPAPLRGRRPELLVASDPFERGAEILVDWLRRLARERDRVRLAIPGGSALEVVARAVPRLGALWSRVVLTWVDERCVPVADPESNRGAALRRGIALGIGVGAASAGGGPGARFVPLFEDGESPEQARARVEQCYASELGGGLDLVVLGLGADGHVASLFPGRAEAPGFVAYVADSPKPPAERMTLTRAALLRAEHTLLVAAGAGKRAAVERVFEGDPGLPATGLPGLVIVCDPDCAPEAA